jgi:hypothetical protein
MSAALGFLRRLSELVLSEFAQALFGSPMRPAALKVERRRHQLPQRAP